MERTFSRGLALAVLAIAGTAFGSEAFAKPGFAVVTLSPAQFLSNCQSMGGTHSMAPHGGIRCTLPSGQTVDCSFSSDGQAFCNWSRTLPTKGQKQLLGDPLPSTMNPDPAKPPKAGGGGTVPDSVN